MPTNEVIVKQIPSVRVAELSSIAESYEPESISPVVGPLFDELCKRLDSGGITPIGPGIAYYEPVAEGVMVHAAMPVAVDLHPTSDHVDGEVSIVDLPAIEAATLVHRGSIQQADVVVQELARWIDAHGYRGSGFAREVYLACPPDPNLWVTEFQEPVVKVE